MKIKEALLGISLILFSCFLSCAICTYSVTDNCLSTVSNLGTTNNLLGTTGAYCSDIFIQTFGLFSYLIVLLMSVWGVRYITFGPQLLNLKLLNVIGFIILGCIVFTILSSREIISHILQACGVQYLAGGCCGYIFTKLLFINLIQNNFFRVVIFLGIFVLWLYICKRIFFINFETIREKAPKIMRTIRNQSNKKTNVRKETTINIAKSEETSARREHVYDPTMIIGREGIYTLPHIDLLDQHSKIKDDVEEGKLLELSRELCSVLEEFGVNGEIVNVRKGPVVTMFEFKPAPGIKTSRVIGLSDDIARSMSAISARIALIPGQNAIGIELPNKIRQTVYLKDLLMSEAFTDFKTGVPIVLGKDISGNPMMADLTKMPHLLVAGTTGSGKSVAINDMILSILFKFSPDECKIIMVDPKMLELSVYDDIPHLLTPVVTEPKKAVFALKWAVSEMENRYRQMSKLGVRNIDGFNKKLRDSKENGDLLVRKIQTGFDQDTGKPIFETQQLEFEPMPYIIVIVDEMADLMLVAGKDIEAAVQRLAQMARAAGIHLIMATQRPSVDVITGTIKANFPTRVSFQVSSKIDSRTILGEQGAEQLLGQGDMLYMAGGGRIIRIHGPFVKDSEVEKVVNYIKGQGEPIYVDIELSDDANGFESATSESGEDDMYRKAVEVVLNDRKISVSYIQRKLQIGYNRAARIVEEMEQKGVISPPNHAGKRDILI
ncbi:MAG: DNA translocase FtsK 4TM domain-containing protein [Holosporales bacterium]|jgi:S-DNA-T family DNA segregation ATPase FtsK/SpoIIIE|nr:DNA translocase FtsK 4TM domain-containing protein [Holosporales bacterium]